MGESEGSGSNSPCLCQYLNYRILSWQAIQIFFGANFCNIALVAIICFKLSYTCDLVSMYGCMAMLCGAYVECVICGHVCARVLQ